MSTLSVYNSLSGKKEIFTPITENYVGMYVCGPTVYSNVHLGNCRTFISFDLIYRYLKHLGYKVRYVRNITDAGHLENDADEGEDRIAKKARIEQIEPMEVVQRYTVDFHQTHGQRGQFPNRSCLANSPYCFESGNPVCQNSIIRNDHNPPVSGYQPNGEIAPPQPFHREEKPHPYPQNA